MQATLPLDHDGCFAVLMIDEGGELDLSPNDAGNWTGGTCGAGVLGGSRWGISSASYPDVNKASLTRMQAQGIYLHDFYLPNRCADLPGRLRFLVYSAAVNSGAQAAVRWLQSAILVQGVTLYGGVDGQIGPHTVLAAQSCDADRLAREFSAQRLFTVSQDGIFAQDRLGLSRRIINDAMTAALPQFSGALA